MKVCDVTQFYSPVSGGVKRYVSEKVRYVREHTGDEHVLVVPGDADTCTSGERSRVYTIASPLISRTSRYRVMLRLAELERILELERPDVIESGDPYQVAWKAVRVGQALRIPVVGFYHSHFPEAYLRSAQKYLGRIATELLLEFSRRYIGALYNRFERTLVPSPALGELLTAWGVRNIEPTDLGVDTSVFRPEPAPGEDLRSELGFRAGEKMLLYVGRLAAEKNTQTLFHAFRMAAEREPRARLVVIGDGLQRAELQALQGQTGRVTWTPYCEDAPRLAQYYRAADLFVHPGVQETFGLVTLEAQACGTPVVGIRGSYMDRIVAGGQEHWARENTPEALAAAILSALAGEPPEGRTQLAREIAEWYSWTGVFERLFDLYRRAIADYPTRLS